MAWGNRDSTAQVTFSPDGKHIIEKGDRSIAIWNMATREGILEIPGGEATASCFAVSPCGGWIVTGGRDKSLKLWDTDRGQLALTLYGHEREVNAVAFSPDSQRIISGSSDGTVKLWDLSTCETTAVLREREHRVRSALFSPDGTSILSASTGRSIFRSVAGSLAFTEWDTATGVRRRSLSGSPGRAELQTPSGDLMTSCAFSRDGKRFVAGAWYDPRARSAPSKLYWPVTVWEMTNESKIKGLTEHQETVWAVAFSPDGRRIASASAPETLLVSDAVTRATLLTTHEPAGKVTAITFTPDGRQLAVGTDQGSVALLDSGSGELSLEVPADTGGFVTVTAIAVSPDGKQIASGSSDGTVKLWDTASGQGIQTQREHESEVTCLAYSPDSMRLVSGSDDATLRIWNTENGGVMLVLRGHTSRVTCVAFSPDGAQLVSGSWEETLRLWTAVGAPMHPLRGSPTLRDTLGAP